MEYRKDPKTGKVYTFETMWSRYGAEMPDAGVCRSVFDSWEKVDIVFDSKTDTMLHIKRVAELLNGASVELLTRAFYHDASKLKSPEKEMFDFVGERLRGLTYGSEEYKKSLLELKPALDHHYKHNSHHPEHYPDGVDGFDLFDLIEMFFDWKAASERHDDGNIFKSIEINKTRFKLSEQVVNILTNTAQRLNYK